MPDEPWWVQEQLALNRAAQERRIIPKGYRYYCPRCGEVHYGHPGLGDSWVVEAHAKWEEVGRYASCPGGLVHKDLDRAP